MDTNRGYTIMEAAKLSGLPESTLRYYETIGIIKPIKRDSSSKHRVYSEDDLNLIIGIACLSATGMSIDDMHTYLSNADRGENAAPDQIALLEAQSLRLANEERYLKLRQKYLQTKVEYWKAISDNNERLASERADKARGIAKELKKEKT
jgi:DNA-binding transcriptional MerR regulator